MIELLSIILEISIVVIALFAAQAKKKKYAYGFALTFGIYVLFDSARHFNLTISSDILDLLFLVATISALWSMWRLYKSK